MLTIEFQAIETTTNSMNTVSLGAYEVPVLPLAGMKVRLTLTGADAPYDTMKEVSGIVATAPETTVYVLNSGIDAMVFLDNVQKIR